MCYFCPMKKDAAPMHYDSAFAELQQILSDIQNGSVSIDQLTLKMERAQVLVQFCREKLRQTEMAIEQLHPSSTVSE